MALNGNWRLGKPDLTNGTNGAGYIKPGVPGPFIALIVWKFSNSLNLQVGLNAIADTKSRMLVFF